MKTIVITGKSVNKETFKEVRQELKAYEKELKTKNQETQEQRPRETTVQGLMNMELDMDVMTDYSDRLYIAYVGKYELTEEGKRTFKSILKNQVAIDYKYKEIMIRCSSDFEDKMLTKFFHMLAGYTSEKTYKRYIKE